MSRECAFCDHSSLQDRIIHDDLNSVVSFLSNPAYTDYHALIIPRRHVVPSEQVLTEEEIVEMELEKDRLEEIFRALGFKGVDNFQKTRPDVPEGTGGTKMDHLHKHILPSNPGDTLYDTGYMWGDKNAFKVVSKSLIASQLSVLSQAERSIHGH